MLNATLTLKRIKKFFSTQYLFIFHQLVFSQYLLALFEPDVVLSMLRVFHTTPAQKLFCLHVFRQAEPP